MLLVLLFAFCACEIFEFHRVGESVKLSFRLDKDNINSGFFAAEGGANMSYRVEVRSADHRKILYRVDRLEEDRETHFSFSNSSAQDVSLVITSIAADPGLPIGVGSCRMKFESVIDTFNAEIAKRVQIEPAIYALEHLLKKMNDVTALSRSVSGKIGTLGRENRRMLSIVALFSFATLAGYTVLNIIQLYYMKQYLNEKKYL